LKNLWIGPEMPIFGSNLGQFWPKWVIFEFSTKKRNSHFFRLQRLGFVEKIRKFQCAVFEKNAKNLCFWAFWAKKGPFSNFRWKSENVTFLPIFFMFQKTST
jgi:hypothetical protein